MEEYFAEQQTADMVSQKTVATNKPIEIDVSQAELLGWALGTIAFSAIIFAFATMQYLRKVWNSPKARKKKKKKMIMVKHEREEKSIEQAYIQGPTAVEEFLKQLKKKKKKDWLDIEFKTVCKYSPELPCDIAKKPENKQKNTYPTILPFDHSRVILQGLPNTERCSDYINASYIDGHKTPKAYIIAQGPNRHTISDFWRMIWYEDVHCIVMATNLFEHARQQCEKYWHNQHGRYGTIDVWLNDTDILADFVIRTFTVRKAGTLEERRIKQYQYNGWSDHDCPNPTAVLEYRRRIREFVKTKPGPLLVHCSKGSGRSGAFITIDMALEMMDNEANIDILNLLINLRGFRPGLVRTTQQYEFIYDTVAMYLQCGVTVIDIQNLPNIILKHATKDPQSKLTGFEHQFKTLQVVVPKLSVGECAGGHRAENRRKSRDIMMQPPERSRPYLITHDSNESTDYINACYIDGYRHPNAFIVTQWPLKSTVNDIWRLVYDYNIPTLVILNDMPFSRSYPRFWPVEKNRHMPYGPLTVEFVEETLTEHVASRVFRVRKPKKYAFIVEEFLKYLQRKCGCGQIPMEYKNMLSSLLQFLCPPFLDQIESVRYRDIGSHLADITEVMTLVSMQTLAGDSQETAKTVRVFQLRSWANSQKSPTNPAYLIDLLTRVQEWQTVNCHGRMPTCVLSKNGVSRVGMYCALSYCWDKLKAEGQIDVFTAVKTIKMNRPQLIDNLVDYMYCYRFFLMFTKMFDQPKHHVSSSSAQCSVEKVAVKPDKITRQQAAINRYSSPPTSFEYVDESPPPHHAGGNAKANPVKIYDHDDKDKPRICITNTISDSGERDRIIGGIEKNNNEVEQNKLPKTKSAPQLAFLLKKAFSTKVEISDECLEGATSSFPKTSITQDGLVHLDQGINANLSKRSSINRENPYVSKFIHCYGNKFQGISTDPDNKTGIKLNMISCYGNPNQDADTTPYESLQNSAHSDIIDAQFSDTNEYMDEILKDKSSKGEPYFPFLQKQKILEPFEDSSNNIPLNLDRNEDLVQVHSLYNNCSNKTGNGSNLPLPRPSFHSSRNSSLSEADCESYKTCSQGSSWSINIDNSSHFNASLDNIEAKALLKKFTDLCPTVPNLQEANTERGTLHGHLPRGEDNSDNIVVDDITDAVVSFKDISNDRNLNCLKNVSNTGSNSNSKIFSHGKGFCIEDDENKNHCEDTCTPCVPIVQVHSPSPSISLKSTDSILNKRTSEESLIKCTSKVLTNQNKTCLPNISIKMKTESLGNGHSNGGTELCKYVTITLGNEKKKQKYSKSEDKELCKQLSTHNRVCETEFGVINGDITGQKSKSDTLLHCVSSQNKYDYCSISNSSKSVVNSENVKELQRVKSDSRLSSFINLGFSSGVDVSYSEC